MTGVELADKWGSEIARTISAAGPDAGRVATEAAMVVAIGNVVAWAGLVLLGLICVVIGWRASRHRLGNGVGEPTKAGGLLAVCAVVGLCIVFPGLLATFPKREIAAFAYPQGYAAVLILDRIAGRP